MGFIDGKPVRRQKAAKKTFAILKPLENITNMKGGKGGKAKTSFATYAEWDKVLNLLGLLRRQKTAPKGGIKPLPTYCKGFLFPPSFIWGQQ